MTGETIAGSVTYGVTISTAGLEDTLTVANTGDIHPNMDGVSGVSLNGGQVRSDGTIVGGGDLYGQSGDGIDITGGGVVTNSGFVQGGDGYRIGGVGVALTEGSLTNSGTILGSTGQRFYNSPSAVGLRGQAGVSMVSGELLNEVAGVIEGARGGFSAAEPGAGGYGITLTGGTVVNLGTILGGNPSNSGVVASGEGGPGAGVTGGTFLNYGTVIGGDNSVAYFGFPDTFVGAAGAGLTLDGGNVTNQGLLEAQPGSSRGGVGVFQVAGTFINDGTVNGSPGAFSDGVGVYLVDGTVINNGTIAGSLDPNGVQHDAVKLGSGSATIAIGPSAIFRGSVVGNSSSSDELRLTSGVSTGSLDMGSNFYGFSTIAFDAGATWHLGGSAYALAHDETIVGFNANDTIILDHFAANSHTFISGTGLELSDGVLTETLNLVGNFSSGSFIVLDQSAGTEVLLCYMLGTQILTPAGEVPVEALNIGDAVITRFGGYRRIKWIGRQSYARQFIESNRAQLPVRFAAGALGSNLPRRDLWVSPGHSMLIENVLILASSLVNGVTITQADCPEEVHYYQLEFETHDCVQAEGCWSESFCDYASLRNQFHNVADFHSLYPNHATPTEHLMCVDRPEQGPVQEAALRPIVARAAALVPPGPLRGCIDSIHPSGIITGWAQDIAHPELPVLLEIVLSGLHLGTVLACDHRPDLAAAKVAQGRAAFDFKALSSFDTDIVLEVRRLSDASCLPMARTAASNHALRTSRLRA